MLNGNSVFLRKLEESDLERTFDWLNVPEISLATGTNYPISRNEQKKWFSSLACNTEKIVFALCLTNTEHIGNVSLDTINQRHKNARFSIFIANSKFRKRGYGEEAMSLLITYSFSFLNLHKIYCKTNADNERVIAFYKKLGFEQEGILREHEFLNGKYVDKVMLGMINQ